MSRFCWGFILSVAAVVTYGGCSHNGKKTDWLGITSDILLSDDDDCDDHHCHHRSH